MREKLALLAVILLAALLLPEMAHQPEEGDTLPDYQTWKTQFGQRAGIKDADDAYRKTVYQRNLDKIRQHNSRGDTSYKMGVNQFTALTEAEFVEQHLAPIPGKPRKLIEPVRNLKRRVEEVDWTTKGSVSPVRDQGSCSASYAFASVGAIESAASIEYVQQIWYSPQQIIDCTQRYGNQGCVTGNIVNSFNYAGYWPLMTDFGYPYKGYVQQCQSQKGTFRIKGYEDINSC